MACYYVQQMTRKWPCRARSRRLSSCTDHNCRLLLNHRLYMDRSCVRWSCDQYMDRNFVHWRSGCQCMDLNFAHWSDCQCMYPNFVRWSCQCMNPNFVRWSDCQCMCPNFVRWSCQCMDLNFVRWSCDRQRTGRSFARWSHDRCYSVHCMAVIPHLNHWLDDRFRYRAHPELDQQSSHQTLCLEQSVVRPEYVRSPVPEHENLNLAEVFQ